MLKKYLEEISKVEVDLILTTKIGDIILNSAIFGKKIPEDLFSYKKSFLVKLDGKKTILTKIKKDILKDNNLLSSELKILKREILIKTKKLSFLEKTYDIEANKLDSSYKIQQTISDYDNNNQDFFSVTHNDIITDTTLKECRGSNVQISKSQLLKLLEYSQSIIAETNFLFGNFEQCSHNQGTVKITDKQKYNLQNVISIFFHEMSHFFRWYNGVKNIGFSYEFQSYMELEEGMAIYNEFYYGNKIFDYGEFVPYYNLCFQILQKDITENQKKEGIYNILKCKGYNKSKSLSYYHRFYRYTPLGGKAFFLKDLTYYSGYKNVIALIEKDKNNYDKLMAGKIGLFEFQNNLVKSNNNFDQKNYYNKMVLRIKGLLNN